MHFRAMGANSLPGIVLLAASVTLYQTTVPGGIELSLANVVEGVLLIVCGYLFRATTAHDRKIASLETDRANHHDDLKLLKEAAATVDKRIENSRHLLRNELTPMFANLEDHFGEQLDRQTRLLEQRIGDIRSNGHTGDPR